MTTTYDVIEKSAIEQAQFDISSRLESLHSGFKSEIDPGNGLYTLMDNTSVADTVRDMYRGVEVDGRQTLGLKEISEWKINPEYAEQNISQHAGFAAEIISTQIENNNAARDGTGVITKRVDDLSAAERKAFGGRFDARNDQYADKVRIKPDGSFETVQTKFVGHDAKSCLEKLTSKKYDKYIESGKVDKFEIPKDYYDEVKTRLYEKTDSLRDQYDRLRAEGKTAEAEKVAQRIEKNNKLDEMLEASVIDKKTAVEAVKNPKLYAAKQMNKAELKQGAQAAALTAAVSGVENYNRYKSGEISGTEALANVAKDSAVAGGIAYGTEIVTQLAGGSSVPGAIITMGVESFDDVKSYVDGEIGGEELTYNLGKNAASTIGGVVGGIAGGTLGTVAGPVGSVAGGMAGAAAGSAAAVKAYEEVTEFVNENMDTVIEKGSEIAGNVGDAVTDLGEAVVEKAGEIKDTISDAADNLTDKAEDLKDAAVEKVSDIKDSASEALGSLKNKISSLGN